MNFLNLPELVVDMEHPAHLSPYKEGFELTCVGVYDGTEPRLLTPGEARVFLKKRWNTHLIIFHSGKSDITAMRAAGVVPGPPENCADTMIAANVLNENRNPRELGLKPLVRRLFKREVQEFDENLDQTSEEFRRYAIADCTNEWDLWQLEKEHLRKFGLEEYFHTVLMPALPAVADMEWSGVGWDFARAREFINALIELRNQCEAEIKTEFGDVNLHSADDLRDIFFNKLKLSFCH